MMAVLVEVQAAPGQGSFDKLEKVPDPASKPMTWWYEQVLTAMLANPQATLKELAAFFEVSPQYLRMITRTDTFRERYEREVREQRSIIMEPVRERLAAIGDQALSLMEARLQEEEAITLRQAQEAAKFALTGLGYFTPSSPSVVIHNNNQTLVATQAPVSVLAEARTRLLRGYDASHKTDTGADGSVAPGDSPAGDNGV